MPAPRNDRAIGLVACAALPMGISSVTTVAIKIARVLRAAQELLEWNRALLCGRARSLMVGERTVGASLAPECHRSGTRCCDPHDALSRHDERRIYVRTVWSFGRRRVTTRVGSTRPNQWAVSTGFRRCLSIGRGSDQRGRDEMSEVVEADVQVPEIHRRRPPAVAVAQGLKAVQGQLRLQVRNRAVCVAWIVERWSKRAP